MGSVRPTAGERRKNSCSPLLLLIPDNTTHALVKDARKKKKKIIYMTHIHLKAIDTRVLYFSFCGVIIGAVRILFSRQVHRPGFQWLIFCHFHTICVNECTHI